MNLTFTQPISLISQGKNGAHGKQYSKREIEIAEKICKLVLTLSNVDFEQKLSQDMISNDPLYVELVGLLEIAAESPQKKEIQLIRNVYRLYEQVQLCTEKTIKDFPKVDDFGNRKPRNISSINVLLRKVLKQIVPDRVNTMIPLTKEESNDL